ncbi:MAG TPA: LytR C-terminal domain-containing protein [Candidatus Eisenbacteria bacterium]
MGGAAEVTRRIAIGLLATLALALLLSWGYARLRPPGALRTHGALGRVIRVQVLNGSGEGGVASRVASYLKEGGFHVVEVRNADRFDYFATMVVARRDDPAAARVVARYLGRPPVIRQAWDSDLAEVTVVIGSDRSRLRLGP